MFCLAIILGACSGASQPAIPETTPVSEAASGQPAVARDTTATAGPSLPATAAAGEPSATDAELPQPENQVTEAQYIWDQLLQRDAILPIYEPEFLPAQEAPYRDNELGIGVELNGDARAYAIGPLLRCLITNCPNSARCIPVVAARVAISTD